jgi:hypothetical protein
MIWRRAWIPILLASLLAGVVAAAAQQSSKQPQSPQSDDDRPLTLEEIRALVARAIANQHADDHKLSEYDRIEHTVQREGGKNAVTTDTVERVFPTGTGDVRVTLKRNGKSIEAATIEQQWMDIAEALTARSDPSNPSIRQEFERQQRREHAHAEMIDDIGKAFHFNYRGHVTLTGRPVIELTFDPDTSFHSSSRYAAVFAHLGGTVWVDESSGQVMRVEAELHDDVAFGAGIIAKVYRGSWLKVTQSEVAPNLWVPVIATYDIEARKFVFPVSWRGEIDATEYRHVGPPAQALLVVRREHTGAITSTSDH